VRDEKQIKSYRRSLRSAMVRMKEVATRTVQSQKWDPSLVAEFMQDVDGYTSELLKSANVTLMQLDQKTLTTWANSCAEQGRQVIHLAAEAYELLTPDAWTLEDCDEYMTELDEELKRLKDLFKLFLTDKLNLAMRREAAKLTNNVNTEVTKACKIVQRLIAIHEAGVISEEDQEKETSRPVMGTIGEPVDTSDGSGRYVGLPQEAQTPRPLRRSRSGKENDGEAVSPSQLPPRISSGLTVRISNLQVGTGAPADSSTPQEVESRSLPVIYLDDVADTGRSSPRSARGEGQSRAEEEMGLADSWDLSPGGPRARTRMRPNPPPNTFLVGARPIRGRRIVGATVAPTVQVVPDPAQNAGATQALASATKMKAASQAQATPTRGKEVEAALVTRTAPDLNQDGEIVGAAPEADATTVRNLVAPARVAGALVEAEMRKSTMAAIPRRRRSRETRGAAAGRPLQDATGHLMGEISEGVSLGMRSRARSCRA
jgi:hypothetical protein